MSSEIPFAIPNRRFQPAKVAALPFRFKAGGGGAAMPDMQHHHRNTTKVSHKPFKPRFSTKNTLRDRSKGKTGSVENGTRKTKHQQVMSKFDKRNQAKQKRLTKQREHAKVNDVFAGKDGAPRIVAVVPLCDNIDPHGSIASLNSSLDAVDTQEPLGTSFAQYDRFKQKVKYVPAERQLFTALDACRIADYVLFILSAEEEVDEFGELMIRSVESQGISTVYTAVNGLDKVEPPKRRPQTVSSLKSYIQHFFSGQEKVFSLDSPQECQNLIRSLCTTTPKGIQWRDNRSWMVVDDARWAEDGPDMTTSSPDCKDLIVTGVVRGKNLKADRLVHVGDWGDFQVAKISTVRINHSNKAKGDTMAVDSNANVDSVETPSADQETLDELAPAEVAMADTDGDAASTITSSRKGVLLDDQRYYSEDESEDDEFPKAKRVPRGTSKYQSAWYLDDVSDSGSDLEDVEENEQDSRTDDFGDQMDVDDLANGNEHFIEPEQSEFAETEGFVEPFPEDHAEGLSAFRSKRKGEAEEDLRFPDEVELHPNVVARERLDRYRGLRSLKTSTWDTEEDKPHEPEDWSRLVDVTDYKGAKNKVMHEALTGGIAPGTRVQVHLKNVPSSVQPSHVRSEAVAMFSLLRHERKHTGVNYTFTLDSEYPEPLKSKDEIIVQCGPRRFVINPLFSQMNNTPNDVHKSERYLHPGRTAVASFTGPLTWGAVPVLYFQQTASEEDMNQMVTSTGEDRGSSLQLIGHGTSLAPSTSRVIAKRAVLTGEPYKVHRKMVTVRYMFFNADDVAWFKALRIWTNRGRQGTIKESLGTHGYFKAVFDGKIGMQDAIGLSLFKRVWPRPARPLQSCPSR
ncbi:MAG: hypothetical protein M1831_002274 [Alyxoria varia]|nr:MAG: hypothetical protein M1831_002274 [Alyxoria varia]